MAPLALAILIGRRASGMLAKGQLGGFDDVCAEKCNVERTEHMKSSEGSIFTTEAWNPALGGVNPLNH